MRLIHCDGSPAAVRALDDAVRAMLAGGEAVDWSKWDATPRGLRPGRKYFSSPPDSASGTGTKSIDRPPPPKDGPRLPPPPPPPPPKDKP